jgi:ribonuclease BN (tRNA processing enzyme)
MQNFERSGASINDLDAILLTHLHVDHSVDLPVLIKASYFTRRDTELPLYGPEGNDLMPGTREFVQALLGPAGAYRYLSSYLDGSESWRLSVHEIEASGSKEGMAMDADGLKITYVPVHHGPLPALAWRVELSGKSLVFSGDMSGRNNTLAGLAAGADLLLAHNAIPEDAGQSASSLHMPPSEIGRIAAEAGVKSLLLSHRMNRSLGREEETLGIIRRVYKGPIEFAEDMMCVSP